VGHEDGIATPAFSIWQPGDGTVGDSRLVVPRPSGDDARLVELANAPVDMLNTVLPPDRRPLFGTLRPLLDIGRLSTFAIATVINRAVATLAPGDSYVNVGTWHGFSFLAGMAGNPDRTCIGIDDFSITEGPREPFYERFERLRGPSHHFHEMDYRDYFSRVHEGTIGLYFYDGNHSYPNQRHGLEVAEPYFGDGCIVLVDDTNWRGPYSATYDFIAASEREYTVLLDVSTPSNLHPTYWNGLLVLRCEARERSGPPPAGLHEKRNRPTHFDPVPLEPEPPLVSVVVCNLGTSPERLAAVIEEVLGQRWPALEVVLADELPSAESRQAAKAYGDRVVYVAGDEPGDGSAMRAAVEATHAGYVAFTDAETVLGPSAVDIGLGFPQRTRFYMSPIPGAFEPVERALALNEEVSRVVPRGDRFALANGKVPWPNFHTGREAIAFLDESDDPDRRPADDGAASDRLEELRGTDTGFLVLGWSAFDWLDRYPSFRDRLESNARRVLESDNAIVFDLRC
jgi:hypothetical protein